jgi:hypothetical protein
LVAAYNAPNGPLHRQPLIAPSKGVGDVISSVVHRPGFGIDHYFVDGLEPHTMSPVESPLLPNAGGSATSYGTLLAFVLLYILGGIGIVAVMTYTHLLEVQFVSAKYDGGIEFIGTRKDEHSPTTYFSVRVKNGNDQPITSDCPLVLHWQEHVLPVHTVTPEILRAAGIAVKQPDYKGPEWRHGFVGGGEQNQGYGIEFHMRKDRIVEFYARHNSSAPCPFQLSNGDQSPVTFPLSQDQLERAFGQPKEVIWFWGH